jgi:Fic family protein
MAWAARWTIENFNGCCAPAVGEWEPWVLFMINSVAESSKETLRLVEGIRALIAEAKNRLRHDHPKIYSQDLLNNLFRHPYTRIEFVQNELGISRPTATKYLDEMADSGLLTKHKHGRNNYYINRPLVDLFVPVSPSISEL